LHGDIKEPSGLFAIAEGGADQMEEFFIASSLSDLEIRFTE
jgi:hypothetical protein